MGAANAFSHMLMVSKYLQDQAVQERNTESTYNLFLLHCLLLQFYKQLWPNVKFEPKPKILCLFVEGNKYLLKYIKETVEVIRVLGLGGCFFGNLGISF